MTLAQALGYSIRPANPLQRLFQALGATPPGAWFFSWFLPRVDPLVFRLSRGRLTLPSLLAGLPVIMITTTGARSGASRTSPLLGIPVGDELALVGSNFGQKSTPGWVYNLEAEPAGTATYRDRSVEFTARRATSTEADAVIDEAAKVYAGYGAYRERISGREIGVFLLSRTC